MNREVRWIIQVSPKDHESWIDRPDLTYTGWFYSNGDDQPTDTLLADLEDARKNHPHLDVRLLREIRTFESKVVG